MTIASALLSSNGAEPSLEMLCLNGHENPDRPAILFIHGYTSGAWQFAEHAMPELATHGWASFAINLRGHGASGGREHIHKVRFADYAADVSRAVEYVREATGRTPILIGHSLGSVLARHYASTHELPALGLLSFGDISLGMKGFMLWMMKRYPFQGVVGMMTGRPSALFAKFGPQYAVMYEGHDQTAVASNVERLMSQPDSNKVFMELGKLDLGAPKGNPPILVLAGDRDPIASGGSTQKLAHDLGVTPVILPGQAHDILAGPDWQKGVGQVRDWLERIAPGQ